MEKPQDEIKKPQALCEAETNPLGQKQYKRDLIDSYTYLSVAANPRSCYYFDMSLNWFHVVDLDSGTNLYDRQSPPRHKLSNEENDMMWVLGCLDSQGTI